MRSTLKLFKAFRHECHASGCTREIAPRLLMCKRHWCMVPRGMRIAVLTSYLRGQEIDKRPSAAWVHAAKCAIEVVAAHEGRRTLVSGD